MENKKILVKEESLEQFLSEIVADGIIVSRGHENRKTMPIEHLREWYLIKKDGDLSVNDEVTIELEGGVFGSPVKLLHAYTYIVEEYDDVCSKLVFDNYNVAIIDKPENPFRSTNPFSSSE